MAFTPRLKYTALHIAATTLRERVRRVAYTRAVLLAYIQNIPKRIQQQSVSTNVMSVPPKI
eukprot:4349562-Amphidinium_carterae.1